MAAGAKNYYEVLGVPPSASLEEIKKRYRQLARQLHPDVNPNDPNAARRFSEVAEAYSVLSTADSRAVHDFELSKAKERADAAAQRRATPYPSGPQRGTNPSPSARPAPSTVNSAAAAVSEGARLTAQAKAAFVRGRLIEARTLSEQALRQNRRNAEAYEVLGDVFRHQGKIDEAMNMYSMALQINPRNPSVMERLERMSRATSGRADGAYRPPPPRPGGPGTSSNARSYPYGGGGASSAPGTSSPTPDSRPIPDYHPEARRPLGNLLKSVFGYGAVLLLLLWAAFYHGEPPVQNGMTSPLLPMIATWNATIVTVMAVSGAILGWTMTATLAIRRIEDELLLPGTATASGGRYLPLGAVLIVLSVLNFYAAALLYLALQFFQEAVTPSIVRVFLAVTVVVALLAAVYTPGPLQVLTFGGNVVFLAFLLGWGLGDIFRPDGL